LISLNFGLACKVVLHAIDVEFEFAYVPLAMSV